MNKAEFTPDEFRAGCDELAYQLVGSDLDDSPENILTATLAAMGATKVYELKPGATYCIQHDRVLSVHQREKIQELLREATNGSGIRFVLLDGGLRLAWPPEGLKQDITVKIADSGFVNR